MSSVAVSGELSVAGTIRQTAAANHVIGSAAIDADVMWIWVGDGLPDVNQGVSVAFNSLKPAPDYNAWAFRVWPNFTTAATGTHPEIIGARIEFPGIVSGGASAQRVTALKIFGPTITGGLTGTLSKRALWIVPEAGDTLIESPSVEISSAGPHAIGGTKLTNRQFTTRGSFAAGAGTASGWYLNSNIAPQADTNAHGLDVEVTLTKAATGTHGLFAGINVTAPTIADGDATVTNAASVYINNAPSGATNNYALWVDAGASRFDGPMQLPAAASGTPRDREIWADADGLYARINGVTKQVAFV